MTYERATYADASYTMSPADFHNGCFIRTINGKPYGYGKTLGPIGEIPLGVPLCAYCDGEIVCGRCEACQVIFDDGPRDCAVCSETLEDHGSCAVGCLDERRVA